VNEQNEWCMVKVLIMVFWRNGSSLVLINKVNLRQARLVMGWVTVSVFNSRHWTFISVCNQPPIQYNGHLMLANIQDKVDQ